LGASAGGDAVTLTSSPLTFVLASPLSPCDVNSDGVTNTADVQLAINQVLGLASKTLDLNADGKTSIVDVIRVINAALGGACRVGS
jgi:hypothetical protein